MTTLEATVVALANSAAPVYTGVQQAPGRHQYINNIPAGSPDLNADERTVYLIGREVQASAPKEGDALSALIQQIKVLPKIAAQLANAPNPTFHWAIRVGDYVHELQGTSMWGNGVNFYQNRLYETKEGWESFEIGTTKFNDISVKDAATTAMNETPELYNVFHNNCQQYALRLADKVLKSGRRKEYLTAGGYYDQLYNKNGVAETTEAPNVLAEKLQSTVSTVEVEAESDPVEVEVAVTQDPEAMKAALQNVVDIMNQKTPDFNIETLTKLFQS